MRAFPKDNFYQCWAEWAKLYGMPNLITERERIDLLIQLGDVVYAPIPGMNILILNSHEVAQELLSKRPNSTAGRSVGYLVREL
jgi:hypothetical protein